MAKTKSAATIDTAAGQAAYALAVQYRTQVEPRLPPQTLADLAADLTTIGAAPPPAAPAAPAPAAPPSLSEALASAAALVSAVHEAVRSATTSSSVRKAYGARSRAAGKEVKEVLAAAGTIVARATAQPSEAMTLGILTSDVAALEQAVTNLDAAETAAHGTPAAAKPSGSARRAAETRMDEAVRRIAGVGALAFALTPDVRAKFEALRTA
jgi:hypothetical protein